MTDVRRVAMISLHTSPLDQPGTGDAGGMNVYVVELARRLAGCGIEVDVFTRATSSALDPVVTLTDGVDVHHVPAGPFEGLTKHELPGQLCVFAREVLRAEAAQPVGHYDVVHSHYWLSGQVGALARDRWGVPLVHSMHTMAKVKNLALAADDQPEPAARVIGEEQVVEAADVLLANTAREAEQLVELYDADPARVEVVHPGVDLDVFRPTGARTGGPGGPAGPGAAAGTALAREEARREVGLPPRGRVVLFCGRIQPLKGPHVLLRAVAALLVKAPHLRAGLVVPIVGGPSGSGLDRPTALAALAEELGVAEVVRFVPPQPREALARWYAAADLVAVPSYNESFGLVAAEAQACGTPVVAASVGGLTTVVDHGRTGLLVDGHDPEVWAAALHRLLTDDEERSRLAAGAAAWARRFSWDATAQATLGVYQRARTLMRESGA